MGTRKMFFFTVMFMLLIITGFSVQSEARVDVSVGFNLPAFRFSAPPPLVVVPGTYVYFAPEADVDIVFYQGYWYRPYEGRWYRSRGHNGPWGHLAPARVPRSLMDLPNDYRHAYRDHGRIEHRDLNRNWKTWERNRHWDKDERWRKGIREERREDRREHRREDRRDRGRP
jgi:hypothetical protein